MLFSIIIIGHGTSTNNGQTVHTVIGREPRGHEDIMLVVPCDLSTGGQALFLHQNNIVGDLAVEPCFRRN